MCSAMELGYSPAMISIMQRIPYSTDAVSHGHERYILGRTRWADYTSEYDLRDGRHPYPYEYLNGYPDLDPWLLPLMLRNRDGWNVDGPPEDTVEWRRHGHAPALTDEVRWTEYRRASRARGALLLRAPLQVRFASRDTVLVGLMRVHRNRRRRKRYWRSIVSADGPTAGNERSNEFVAKWDAARDQIHTRARLAMQAQRVSRMT
ncbi:hypothetical protein B0H11DRAFT_1909642 [Mycena galericulata]|nr:hypothetical protein B0H11DRAFT_1909642 [Mycena galericulata]